MFHSVCDSSMSLGGQISVLIEMGKRALDSLSNMSIRWIVQWSLVDPMEKDAMRDVAKSQSITLPKVIFSQITSEDFAGKRQAFIPSQMTSSTASLDRHWSVGFTLCVFGPLGSLRHSQYHQKSVPYPKVYVRFWWCSCHFCSTTGSGISSSLLGSAIPKAKKIANQSYRVREIFWLWGSLRHLQHHQSVVSIPRLWFLGNSASIDSYPKITPVSCKYDICTFRTYFLWLETYLSNFKIGENDKHLIDQRDGYTGVCTFVACGHCAL